MKPTALYGYLKKLPKYVKWLMFSIESQKFSKKKNKKLSYLGPQEKSFPCLQRGLSPPVTSYAFFLFCGGSAKAWVRLRAEGQALASSGSSPIWSHEVPSPLPFYCCLPSKGWSLYVITLGSKASIHEFREWGRSTVCNTHRAHLSLNSAIFSLSLKTATSVAVVSDVLDVPHGLGVKTTNYEWGRRNKSVNGGANWVRQLLGG